MVVLGKNNPLRAALAQGSVSFSRPAAVLCMFFRTTLPRSRGLLKSDVVTLPLNPAGLPVTLWEHGSGNRIKAAGLGQTAAQPYATALRAQVSGEGRRAQHAVPLQICWVPGNVGARQMACPKFPIVHLAAYPATNRLSAARHGEETVFDDPVVRLSSQPWRIVSCKRVGSSSSAKR